MKFSMVFAASAAFTSVSAGFGTFAVVNRCKFDLYLWSVEGNQAPSKMFTLPANTPHIGYSETYRYAGQYEGVSLKVAPYYFEGGQLPPPSLNITQLEYTVPPPQNNDPSIYYDLSLVNGNSLMGIPFTYSPSNAGAVPQCMSGSCSGSFEKCTAGYNGAYDDWNTHACPKEQDIIFTFCDGNAQQNLIVPTGEVTMGQFSGLHMQKREADAEAEPEADANPLAVCSTSAATNAGDGVPVFAALCADTPAAPPAPAAPVAPAPPAVPAAPAAPAAPAPAEEPSAVAALQQPVAPAPVSSSSSSVAPVATQAAPAPAAPPVSASPAAPLSKLQLSSLANTGVTCWQSVTTGETCGVSARSLPEKRSVGAHNHRHNHQAFHRRNRIIKSVS